MCYLRKLPSGTVSPMVTLVTATVRPMRVDERRRYRHTDKDRNGDRLQHEQRNIPPANERILRGVLATERGHRSGRSHRNAAKKAATLTGQCSRFAKDSTQIIRHSNQLLVWTSGCMVWVRLCVAGASAEPWREAGRRTVTSHTVPYKIHEGMHTRTGDRARRTRYVLRSIDRYAVSQGA